MSIHVTWMDNYDAQFRHSKASLSRAQFKNINWTGVAVRQYMGDEIIDDALVRNANGEIFPAMPDNFLTEENVEAIYKFLINETQPHPAEIIVENQQRIEGMLQFKSLYPSSMLKHWQPDRVPLKPNVNNANVPEKYKAAIRKSPDTLANFYPKAIVNENPASQEGLINLIKDYFNTKVTSNNTQFPQRYLNLTCDENLYKRAMRVPKNAT